jgi:hypothetical protein
MREKDITIIKTIKNVLSEFPVDVLDYEYLPDNYNVYLYGRTILTNKNL